MTQPFEIHTRDEDTATVNGKLIHRGGFATIYNAAIAVIVTRAQDQGRPVLVKAIDGVNADAVSWIMVAGDGSVEETTAPNAEQAAPTRGRRYRAESPGVDESEFYPTTHSPTPTIPTAEPAVSDGDASPADDPIDAAPAGPARQDQPEPAPSQSPLVSDSPVFTYAPSITDTHHTGADPATGPVPLPPRPVTTSLQQQPATNPYQGYREPYAQPWQPQGPPLMRQDPAGQPHVTQRPTVPAGEVTFLSTNTPVAPTAPPATGFKAFLAKLGFASGPSVEDQRRWADEYAVSQHWPGPRTIAVVNGKGGSTKTPTTAMLSAVFARFGGSGVAAWDANFTRGTLGWRTEQGFHDRTLLELIPKLDDLLSPSANSADLAGYLHHQTSDKYDVLRSNPALLKRDQQLPGELQDRVHQLLTKHYRILFIDSGNDEGDAVWLRMIEQADAIVVPSLNKDDHAEAAKRLLQGLRASGPRSAQLANNAVVIVSHGQAGEHSKPASHYVERFSQLARSVVTVPHDGALIDGWLRYDDLRPTTQRAWLRAAAAVAEGLTGRLTPSRL